MTHSFDTADYPLGFFCFLFFKFILAVLVLFFLINLVFWLHWVFIAAHGLSLVVASGGYSSGGVQASHCSGFSCCGVRALGVRASVAVARGFSSCGTWVREQPQ